MRGLNLVLLMLLAAPVAAQQPDPGPEQTAGPVAVPVIPETPAPIPIGARVGELITGYDSGGRRDPFASLIEPKRSGEVATQRRPAGLAGVALADVQVRGIVRKDDVLLAILEGPDRKSYVSRVNDRLLDATVVRIDADGVIFAENTERGMAPNHLRKWLRPTGELVQ
ncbi:MAG: hypothetical protein DIU54_011130 [Acidobacteriota bacterium]|jgi:hypothetical protein|nr:MAG: hypothetical protein DIU54_07780 [Acidobacteriota bacterium]